MNRVFALRLEGQHGPIPLNHRGGPAAKPKLRSDTTLAKVLVSYTGWSISHEWVTVKGRIATDVYVDFENPDDAMLFKLSWTDAE